MEIDNIIGFTDDSIEGEITYLRTKEGEIRLPRTVADAIQVSLDDSTNIIDYIDSRISSNSGGNGGTLYTQRLLGSSFYEDNEFYSYEIENPVSSINIICSLLNDAGEVLVNNLKITKKTIKVTLEQPEDCWISISGTNASETIFLSSNDNLSHSHTNKGILDKFDVINNNLSFDGKELAFKQELNKINTILEDILERLVKLESGNIQNPLPDTKPDIPSEPTQPDKPVIPEEPSEPKKDYTGLIINQVYGGGVSDDGPISNTFIELYNNSENDYSLAGLSIQIGTTGLTWEKLNLLDVILPSHCSYLIRMADNNLESPKLVIDNYDDSWSRQISNKGYKVALVNNTNKLTVENPANLETIIDLVGGYNEDITLTDSYESEPFNGVSKQKSIRRINFIDTNNNAKDFEIIDYRIEENIVYKPRCLNDGAWTETEKPDLEQCPVDSELPVVFIDLNQNELDTIGNTIATIKLFNNEGSLTFKKSADISYQNFKDEDEGRKQSYKFDLLDPVSGDNYDHQFDGRWTFSNRKWEKLNEYILKANYTDLTHAHNIVTSNIIRNSYRNSINTTLCSIDGFPVLLYVNNEKYGIYTWNLSQHRKNYGLEKATKNENHLMFRAKSNTHSSCLFNGECTDTSNETSQWEDRHPKAYKDNPTLMEQNKVKLNRLLDWVKNADDTTFKNQINSYFNKDYLIDYYIWSYFGGFTDSLGNNLNIVSYDGEIWYPTFYDLDASFGLNHNGDTYFNSDLTFPNGYRCSNSKLWEKVGRIFLDEIKERYAELRSTTMNSEYIMSEFNRFIALIPDNEYDEDQNIWNVYPNLDANININNVEPWIIGRQEYCDTIFQYK